MKETAHSSKNTRRRFLQDFTSNKSVLAHSHGSKLALFNFSAKINTPTNSGPKIKNPWVLTQINCIKGNKKTPFLLTCFVNTNKYIEKNKIEKFSGLILNLSFEERMATKRILMFKIKYLRCL